MIANPLMPGFPAGLLNRCASADWPLGALTEVLLRHEDSQRATLVHACLGTAEQPGTVAGLNSPALIFPMRQCESRVVAVRVRCAFCSPRGRGSVPRLPKSNDISNRVPTPNAPPPSPSSSSPTAADDVFGKDDCDIGVSTGTVFVNLKITVAR